MKRIAFVAAVLICSCNSRHITTPPVPPAFGISINGKLFASVFQQKAAEYRALCFQAYNIARFRLDNYKPVTGKPKAIVTDIDETVLDNSPYEVHQTLQGKDYEPATWYEWTDKSAADTLPGSATFLKYASSKGVEIFYITNRDERERASTLRNLQRFNLPNTDDSHLLVKQTTSGKQPRRESVASTHEIIMLIGDNLSDFSNIFDKKPMAERTSNTNLAGPEFGDRFIILPNTVYGDWESSLFKFERLTQSQKDSVIRKETIGY